MSLLTDWGDNASGRTYERIMDELVNGNSYLMLPSIDTNSNNRDWVITEDTTSLKLTCIFKVEGIKVIGGFTDERSMLMWANKPTPYVALRAQAVFKLCEDYNIFKIVINSGSPNICLAQRSREHLN